MSPSPAPSSVYSLNYQKVLRVILIIGPKYHPIIFKLFINVFNDPFHVALVVDKLEHNSKLVVDKLEQHNTRVHNTISLNSDYVEWEFCRAL